MQKSRERKIGRPPPKKRTKCMRTSKKKKQHKNNIIHTCTEAQQMTNLIAVRQAHNNVCDVCVSLLCRVLQQVDNKGM